MAQVLCPVVIGRDAELQALDAATGEVIPAQYRELFVLRRQGDGWKIAEYMFQPVRDALDAGH